MYCSSCGAALTQELSYCNRCGADLKPSESLVSTGKPKGIAYIVPLSMAMTIGVALGGLAVVFSFLMELMKAGFPLNNAMILAVFSLLMLLGTVALLSRHSSRLIGVYLQSGDAIQPKKPKLSGQPPAQLDASREPVLSVTEHTTRTLEPSYRQQRT
jgi:hypothetical protein